MTLPNRLQAFLEEQEIPLGTLAHLRTSTSRSTAQAAQVPEDRIAKGVFLKDEARYLLAVPPAHRGVRLGAVAARTGRDRSLAPEKDVAARFEGRDPGAVPPLGAACGLDVIVDASLTSLADVYLKAGDHRHLIHLRGDRLRQLMRGARIGHFTHPG